MRRRSGEVAPRAAVVDVVRAIADALQLAVGADEEVRALRDRAARLDAGAAGDARAGQRDEAAAVEREVLVTHRRHARKDPAVSERLRDRRLETVEGRAEAVAAAQAVRVGFLHDERERVVRAERHHVRLEPALADGGVVAHLVVVEARRDRPGEIAARRCEERQHRVDVGAPHAREHAAILPVAPERAFGEPGRPIEVRVEEAAGLVVAPCPALDVDHAADRAAVAHAESTGKKIDPRERFGRDDGGDAAEVIQLRDLLPVEEHACVAGSSAADHQHAETHRRSRDARKVLHALQRVVRGAGDVADLARLDRPASLARAFARRLDDDLLAIGGEQRERCVEARHPFRRDLRLAVDRLRARRGDGDLVLSGRERDEARAAIGARRRRVHLSVGRDQDDGGSWHDGTRTDGGSRNVGDTRTRNQVGIGQTWRRDRGRSRRTAEGLDDTFCGRRDTSDDDGQNHDVAYPDGSHERTSEPSRVARWKRAAMGE